MASVPRAPVPEHERRGETVGIQGIRPLFSVARCTRPVNGFQIETCPQFWNLDCRRPSIRQGDFVFIRTTGGLCRLALLAGDGCLARNKLESVEHSDYLHSVRELNPPPTLRFARQMQHLLDVLGI